MLGSVASGTLCISIMNKEGGNRVYLPLSLVHPASCCLSNTKLSSYTVKTINYIHTRVLYNKSKLSVSRFDRLKSPSEHKIYDLLILQISDTKSPQ
jgi:hypothetical protein